MTNPRSKLTPRMARAHSQLIAPPIPATRHKNQYEPSHSIARAAAAITNAESSRVRISWLSRSTAMFSNLPLRCAAQQSLSKSGSPLKQSHRPLPIRHLIPRNNRSSMTYSHSTRFTPMKNAAAVRQIVDPDLGNV